MSETVIEPTGDGQAGTQTATPTPAPSGTTTPAKAGAPAGAGGTADPGATGTKSAEPKAAGTALDGTDDKPVASPSDWPADWREKLAGEDKAFLNVLKRYTSPLTYARAGFEAQQRIRSGEVKKPLGADATPEEIAAFRTENGIPAKAEEYKIELADGMIPGEADKPILDGFKEFAHGKNWTPGQLNEVLNWYYSQQDAISAQRFETDKTIRTETEEVLRSEWGPEYRGNVNSIKNFLAGAPEGVADALIHARAPDGTVLGNNPAVLRWLADMARESMPGAGLIPAGTSNPSAAMETEIENIQRMMREEPRKYYGDEKIQTRYRDLIAARSRSTGRAA